MFGGFLPKIILGDYVMGVLSLQTSLMNLVLNVSMVFQSPDRVAQTSDHYYNLDDSRCILHPPPIFPIDWGGVWFLHLRFTPVNQCCVLVKCVSILSAYLFIFYLRQTKRVQW